MRVSDGSVAPDMNRARLKSGFSSSPRRYSSIGLKIAGAPFATVTSSRIIASTRGPVSSAR
jgi:hypothetical protein